MYIILAFMNDRINGYKTELSKQEIETYKKHILGYWGYRLHNIKSFFIKIIKRIL